MATMGHVKEPGIYSFKRDIWFVVTSKSVNPQFYAWWRHQMETFSALLAICAGNSPFLGEFPTQRPVTRSFDAYFDLRLNKRLCKQSWGWWFETLLCPLWRHSNGESFPTTNMDDIISRLCMTRTSEYGMCYTWSMVSIFVYLWSCLIVAFELLGARMNFEISLTLRLQ